MAHLFIIDSEKRKEVTAKELCEFFNVDYQKIVKKPLFKNNKNKKPNYLGSRAGSWIMPYFKTKHPDTGIDIEIRYADSWIPDSQNKNVFKYQPVRLHFYGQSFTTEQNDQIAVWFFLNKLFKPKVEYEFVDTVQNAKDALRQADDVERALVLSRKIEDSKVPVLLKGLARIIKLDLGDIELMSLVEQRSAFRNIALKYPAIFIRNVEESPNAKVEGTILQLIDKRGIVLLQEGPYRVWRWAVGPKSGKQIGATIKEVAADTVSLLVTEIVSKPSEYKEDLIQALERAMADYATSNMSAEWGDFDLDSTVTSMKSIVTDKEFAKNPNDTKTDLGAHVMNIPDADMGAIRDFCELHGFSKGAPEVAAMKRAIEDGVINKDNIELWCEKNLKKSK